MSVVRVDGGAVFVLSGAPARVAVDWTLVTGEGELVSLADWTDDNGIASARYKASAGADPAEAGDTVTVRARVYA
jgi:hypothetical protein